MADEHAEPVIELRDVHFAYGSGPTALEAATLDVMPLDFTSVIGPNGGGKTTLLRLILGLLVPSRGSVRVLGTTPAKARPLIGYMPQHVSLDPSFPVSAGDVVLMGRQTGSRPVGPYTRADREAARAALAEVGLEPFWPRPFATLSGGERQRVLVARALASRPGLLLLDEPAAGLDVKAEQEFYELLRELNRTITILVVSHDLGFVAGFVSRVICVRREVEVHPTSAVDGDVIARIYGGDVRMVRHDQRLEH